jgi:beta-1,4-mannosyl-glycoprotein beta-1,4-N-acetylglucosaminyltransferase
MSKIYDCFPFFNELDLLEIRLNALYDKVDYFVISECDYTFSGLPKPFYFEDNKDKFSKFMDKIIHVKNYDTKEFTNIQNKYEGKVGEQYQKIINRMNSMIDSPETEFGKGHWCRDYLHKELTMLKIVDCDPDDIILFGDCDEIPNPEKISEVVDLINQTNKPYVFKQKNMTYWVNNENITDTWYGQYIIKYSDIIESSCMFTRNNRVRFDLIEDGGWHLTFMGGENRVKEKLIAYSHQEYNNQYVLESVETKMKDGRDVLNRNVVFNTHDLNTLFPSNIIDLINEKFKYLIR